MDNPTRDGQMKFSVALYGFPAPERVAMGVLAEKYGLHAAFIPDHLADFPPSFSPDPWSVLTAVGVKTKRILLGSGVTDLYRTHPVKIVHIASTLDELTHGRVLIGVGSGEAMNLVPYGIPFEATETRIARIKEAVRMMKLLWSSDRRKPVSFDGKFYTLTEAWLDHNPAQKEAKVYIGAFGSNRMLEAIGEVGDGWYGSYNTPDVMKKRIEAVKRGAQRTGRDWKAIDCVTLLPIALTRDKELQLKAIRAFKASAYISSRKVLERMGLNIPHPEGVETPYQYIPATETSVGRAAQAATSIPDDAVRDFMAVGSVEQCIESVERFRKAGTTHFVLYDLIGQGIAPSLKNLEKSFRIIEEEFFPSRSKRQKS